MINKQRNMIIKPLRVDNSNKLLNKVFPDGKKSQNVKSPLETGDKKIVSEIEKQTFNPQHEDFSDDYDDTSSVSSCESDCREINIWDNSELRLRAINTEEFSDFYGKRLSFLQLYKIRSYFYTKGFRPHLGDIFKDAEKIHKFCRMQLNLDDFLEEEAKCNLIDLDMQKDKNFARFSRFFEQHLELNSQKMRDEFYDRYSCVNFEQGCESPEYQSYSPQKRNSTFVRAGPRMISGLNLSPRKPPKKRLLTELNQQTNHQEQVRKSQLNLLQLSEMQRKQKIKMSQQRLMQGKLTEQGIQNIEDTNKQNFLIADLEVQDNFASTSDSNYQKSNSSCGSQHDCSQKINNNNPTNKINLRFTGSAAQSPVLSPHSIGSFKRSSPTTGSQKSPNLSEQNEFRLKLCNTRDFDELQTNQTNNSNYGLDSKNIAQFNQNSSIQNQNKGASQKAEQISSFTKFLSSSQSPKKRQIPNSVNASPAIKPTQKLNYDFNNLVRQSQNPIFNSISVKKSTNYTNQQQIPIQSEYQLGGKTNSINTSIKELKLPNIGTGLKDIKQSFKLSSESPVRNSQFYNQMQVQHSSASPNQNQISPFKPSSIQQNYQRTHKKFQSTVFGEEARKQFQQVILQKQ